MKYQLLISDIVANAGTQMLAINENEMGYKKNDQAWSKKEILGHLIDSCYNNHRRLVLAKIDHLIFDGYDQDEWVMKNNYQQRRASEIINTWQVANLHLVELISMLPESLLLHQTRNHNFHQIAMKTLPSSEITSLSYLIWDYIHHMEHHLGQIILDFRSRNQKFN